MNFRVRWLSLTLLALAPVAQAAEVRIGVQGGGGVPIIAPVPVGEVGANLSVQWPLSDSLQVRETLEGGVIFDPSGNSLGTLPLLRLDTSFLSRGELYFGGGLGTGYIIPSSANDAYGSLFSPIYLLNIHGIVGKDFGTGAVEGVVRLGFISSIGVRATVPLR